MRRVHLRGHENITKRYLVVVAAAFNLGLVTRRLIGVGTSKGLSGRALQTLVAAWRGLIASWNRLLALINCCELLCGQRNANPRSPASRLLPA